MRRDDGELAVTAALGSFAAASGPEQLFGAAADSTVHLVGAVLQRAAGHVGDAPSAAVFRTMTPLVSDAGATVFGRGTHALARAAALCNATAAGSGEALEADLALAVPVVVAACAATEVARPSAPSSMAAFLLAAMTGLEVAARLSDALGEDHLARGWFVAGTAGRVGAAAAAGRAFGLDGPAMANAFGFAATQAAGLAASAGGAVGALVLGLAAADGVEAATLARSGLGGPPLALEGRRGLFALQAPGSSPSRLLDGGDGHPHVAQLGSAVPRSGRLIEALLGGALESAPLSELIALVEALAAPGSHGASG